MDAGEDVADRKGHKQYKHTLRQLQIELVKFQRHL